LAPDRIATVEAALARDPELALRVADYRAQSAMLRDALDPVLAELIPDRLLAAAAQAAAKGPGLARRWGMPALAAAATLVLGVGLGWLGGDAMIERGGTPATFSRLAAFAPARYAADGARAVAGTAALSSGAGGRERPGPGAAMGHACARGGGDARPWRRARLARARCDDRTRRHADDLRAIGGICSCALCRRRAATRRSVGRGR